MRMREVPACSARSAPARLQPPSSVTSSPAAPPCGRSPACPAPPLPRCCAAGGRFPAASHRAGRPRGERGQVPRPVPVLLACPVSVPGPPRLRGRRPRAAPSLWQRPEGAFGGGLEAGNDAAAGAEAVEPGRSHVSGWWRAARRWGRWRVRLARGRGGSSGAAGEGPRRGGSEARQVLELPRGSGLGGGRD